ncbi:hypothetical protein AB4142_29270, partial [Variovorax sp. 2RAF20]
VHERLPQTVAIDVLMGGLQNVYSSVHGDLLRQLLSVSSLVPTPRMGIHPWTLCVRSWNAERPWLRSHAERGNEI